VTLLLDLLGCQRQVFVGAGRVKRDSMEYMCVTWDIPKMTVFFRRYSLLARDAAIVLLDHIFPIVLLDFIPVSVLLLRSQDAYVSLFE